MKDFIQVEVTDDADAVTRYLHKLNLHIIFFHF